ncbi:hypothetical protein ABZ819_05190 [Streptomyces venezuelae]|uniref:hypothetical protein n=1 Tax=Streptomyces venezuelae TaxID=54571 RepID=UPI003447DA5D
MFVDLFDADRSRSPEGVQARAVVVAPAIDLFGDPLTRALYRETTYAVPAEQRLTCPIHQDWSADCTDLHDDVQAAA